MKEAVLEREEERFADEEDTIQQQLDASGVCRHWNIILGVFGRNSIFLCNMLFIVTMGLGPRLWCV